MSANNAGCPEPSPTTDQPSSQKNGFQDLPANIQLKIFSYFTPRELCQMIAPVCKPWWTLSKNPNLWMTLKGIRFSLRYNNDAWYNILLRCNSLTSLTIRTTAGIEKLMECSVNLNNLKVLNLSYCGALTSSIFEALSSNCSSIEDLNVQNCSAIDVNCVRHLVKLKNLSSLNLSFCIGIDNQCIQIIAMHCQKLESLNIDGIQGITDEAIKELSQFTHNTICHLVLSGKGLTDDSLQYLTSCRRLETLKVSNGGSFTDRALNSLTSIPHLTTLGLDCPKFTMKALERFFSSRSLEHLKELEIVNPFLDNAALKNLAMTCRRLEKLVIKSNNTITDKGLEAVIVNCRLLSCLELEGLRKLCGIPLVKIPENLPNLTYLSLEDSWNVGKKILKDLAEGMSSLNVIGASGFDVLDERNSDSSDNCYFNSSSDDYCYSS